MTPLTPPLNGLGRLSLRALVPAVFCLLTALAPVEAQGPARGDSYRVRAGDILRIQIWRGRDQEPISADVPVEASGVAVMPIIGPVQVAGKTEAELRQTLRESYSKEYAVPVVNISPIFPVSVLGAVVTPGAVDASPGMTLFDAISEAGGFLPNAKTEEVQLIRGGQTQIVNATGPEMALQLSELELQSGDRIMVPAKPANRWQLWTTVLQGLSFLATVYVAFK